MLIYDGIHYDALALAAEKGSPEAADFTVFEVGPEADLADMKARSDVMQEESGLSSRVPARQARSFVCGAEQAAAVHRHRQLHFAFPWLGNGQQW